MACCLPWYGIPHKVAENQLTHWWAIVAKSWPMTIELIIHMVPPRSCWPEIALEEQEHSWSPSSKTDGGQNAILLEAFSSVQSLSHVWLFVTPWTAARQASLSITNSQSPPKPMSIESVMPSNHLILCLPLLLLPSIFPSIRVFSNESALCIRWPKYWSYSFNISPFNEHPGLISFRMDWLDLLAVQGWRLSRVFSNTTVQKYQFLAFFKVQLSHPHMTIGKTIGLTRQTFVDKVMSLLFNMLSRLVITFLPRSKRLLISCGCSHHLQWFWSPKK